MTPRAVPLVLATAVVGGLAGAVVLLLLPGAREVVLAVSLIVGAGIDIRTRRVPNWLTAGAGAFALASAGPLLLTMGAGGLAAVAIGLLLTMLARGGYGMGDVKAMGVAGATVGLAGLPAFLLAMSIAGGVWVLLCAWREGSLRGQTVAYAPAVAVGCVWALTVAR